MSILEITKHENGKDFVASNLTAQAFYNLIHSNVISQTKNYAFKVDEIAQIYNLGNQINIIKLTLGEIEIVEAWEPKKTAVKS